MKKLLLPASFLFALLISCGRDPAECDGGESTVMDTTHAAQVKTGDTLHFRDSMATTAGSDSLKKFPALSGTVFYNLPYCRGAAPSQEILDENAKWRTLGNSTVELRSGSQKYEVTTDANGNFSAAIPPGLYELWLTKDVSKKIYDVSPDGCENCLTQAIAKAKISSGGENKIYFTFRCSPSAKLRQ